jgi:serine/threonine protein kinase
MTWEEFKKRYDYDTKKDKLGKGGFGDVYRAHDNDRGRWMALKVAIVEHENLRLAKEVELVASLPLHRNIAIYEECYTFEQYDKECDYGVLQYYEEGNLKQLLDKRQMPHSQIASILTEILEGIAFLHRQKIIHRDLKPQNILIAKYPDGSYVPKITDFGISKHVEGDESFFTNTLQGGTLSYASPEQLKASTIRWNADLWSFGVIAYQAFTGELPFTAGGHDSASEAGRQELFRQITGGKLPDDINKAPEPWQGLIRKCLVVDAEKRIKSAAECLAMLGGLDGAKALDAETSIGAPDKERAPQSAQGVPDLETYIDAPTPPRPVGPPAPPKDITIKKGHLIIGAAALALVLLAAMWQLNKNRTALEPPQTGTGSNKPDGSTPENQKPEQSQEVPNPTRTGAVPAPASTGAANTDTANTDTANVAPNAPAPQTGGASGPTSASAVSFSASITVNVEGGSSEGGSSEGGSNAMPVAFDGQGCYRTRATLSTGTEFRYWIELGQPCYVYVFASDDKSPGAVRIFPRAGASPELSSRSVSPPWIKINGPAGTDYIVVLLSKEALDIGAIERRFASAGGSFPSRVASAVGANFVPYGQIRYNSGRMGLAATSANPRAVFGLLLAIGHS